PGSMLKHLHIRDLAIIDSVELDFAAGFTVLTGETGAGKSILIDAIGLVIGTRADAALVRSGKEKAEISAEFSLRGSPAARAWLEERELTAEDDADLCLIRRVVHAEGRTRAFVNGSAVNAADLRALGELLIEIFGQNESQQLLRREAQRAVLDDYGSYAPALAAVAETARAHAAVMRAIERVRSGGARDPAQVDYLRHRVRELEALALREGELEELEAEHKRLANAGRLLDEGNAAQELLYGGENSIYDQLSQVDHLLGGLAALDQQFADGLAMTRSAQAQAREAADALRRVLDRLDLDPAQLQQCERRLADIHELARKHRLKAAGLPALLQQMQNELAELEQAAGSLDELERKREAALADYRRAALVLGTERRKAAKKFSAEVTALVRQLGMGSAVFELAVDTSPDDPRECGDESVRFDFSANPGQAPRALARVASGGELSRISLAIQVAGLSRGGAATMIFDEVDAGVGGGVAEIVGQKLCELGARRQVLCVTHLAQVAAQGQQQFAISKDVRGGQTYTRVTALDAKARAEELARMLGGVEITASSQAHARELLKRAAKA
ncbi:MAG TPA: DNA repair protein RecN, partial [Nevskiaceae bacterium]|nr:DNA repair protein RecN [Nevskiaceae bacterium]